MVKTHLILSEIIRRIGIIYNIKNLGFLGFDIWLENQIEVHDQAQQEEASKVEIKLSSLILYIYIYISLWLDLWRRCGIL